MWRPELRVPLRTTLPSPSPMTAMVPTRRQWTPPARLHHQTPHLPAQPVRASDCFAGQAAPPRLNERERPPQAWLSCSSFSIRRRLLPLPLRLKDPPETRHPHVHPPLAETHRTWMTFQTPLRPRTVPTSPSPSLTSLPARKRNSPPTASPPTTRRMLHLYVHMNLHCISKCLNIPCGWVSLHTYIIVRVWRIMRGCADSYFGRMAMCSYVCLSCASSGNEFMQRFRARAESHTLNRSR